MKNQTDTRVLEKYNAYKLGWLHDSIHFIVLILALFILFRFVIGFSIVGGDSMNPGLTDGTIVLYLRPVRNYRPGDVISMRVPSGDYYVKRVAAIGGDTVALQDGQVLVNGEAVQEPWAEGETREETGAVIYPYYVREGNVFVLGDNRAVSMDSRAFGEVNRRQIKGKILLQIGKHGIRRV
ncbi:MAG: signal peptidase I [Eubacterium sp.]|nr:signal peptidase I [Eubacterium sp.]